MVASIEGQGITVAKVLRRVSQGASALALAGAVILMTQWVYPAGHLVIRMDHPYISRAVGENAVYVQIDITMKNVGSDAVRVDGEHFILVDDLGNRYPRDPSTHFIRGHYDYLTMPPDFEFTATSIYKIPVERQPARMLFVTGTGENAWFRLPQPESTPPQPNPPSPAPVTGAAAPGPGQLADVLAILVARSRGLSPRDLAQADQLVDLLPHLRVTCSSGVQAHGSALVRVATQCASDAETAMNAIEFLRETLKSPAAEGMPGVARRNWDEVLLHASSAVRDALVPLRDQMGRERASGQNSAMTFRALGYIRDRIGRVLARASSKSR